MSQNILEPELSVGELLFSEMILADLRNIQIFVYFNFYEHKAENNA